MAKNTLTGYVLAFCAAGLMASNIILPVRSYEPVLLTDTQSKDIHLSAGQNFSITCYADSEGEGQIRSLRWSEHNRTIVSEGNKILIRKGASRLTLTISNLTLADSGIYQCNALYKSNQALQTEVYLVVGDGEEPAFENSYENITVTEYSRLDILCQARGTPPIDYKWYDQNENLIGQLNKSSTFSSKTSNGSRLIIDNITTSQSGLYMCSASNKYGLRSKVYRVEVKKGDAIIEDMLNIEDIMVTEVTTNSITFGIPSQKTFDYIDVFYTGSNTYGYKEKVRWQQGDSFTLQNLTPSVVYDIEFQLSLPNNPILNPIKSISVPLFPDVPKVVLTKVDCGTVIIRIIGNRYEIDMFQVSYGLIEYDTSNEKFKRTGPIINTEIPVSHGECYTIGGLLKYRLYEIAVRAHTSAGFGETYIQRIYVSCDACDA